MVSGNAKVHPLIATWHAVCLYPTRSCTAYPSPSRHVLKGYATGATETALMDTRQLGTSDLHITPIGFGAWAIGGSGYEFAWGAQDDRDSITAIHEALDAGINWIDTAAVYGLGHSEEVVARALAGARGRPYVFTKCSLVWDQRGQIGHSLQAQSIRRECEASLRRLRVDTLDLYQI